MKSFLSGSPKLKLALNEDLVVGRTGTSYGSVVLDDCNFHECVILDEFEHARELHFFPPDGEFAVMNYRVTADFRNPFKIFPTVEITGQYKIEVMCTVHADIPEGNHGANVTVRIPVPRGTISATIEHNADAGGSSGSVGSGGGSGSGSGGGGSKGTSAEYNAQEKKVTWTIRKFSGGSELSIRVKITLDQPATAAHKKEIGPIAMSFEIPMYSISNLQVRYLRILETDKSYNPHRWVRYITQSSSYVYRL
jgi:AP-4 complex subunit mu-1